MGRDSAISTSDESRSFFSWSSTFYDLFLQVIFAGSVNDYRRIAARQISSQEGLICLDAATGTGANAYAFSEVHPSHRIVALDISQEMLWTARAKRTKQRIDFVRASIEHLPFKESAFDIVMNSCAYHLLSASKCWPELVRVTKRGGIVVDVDIIHRLWDNPVLNPFLRPCLVYERIRSKRIPLEIPQTDFFRQLGLQEISEIRIPRRLGIVQVIAGKRP